MSESLWALQGWRKESRRIILLSTVSRRKWKEEELHSVCRPRDQVTAGYQGNKLPSRRS